MELGYSLSSEEHRPDALVAQAKRAEEAGFSFALISDHFHPWMDRQGQSAFVWTVIGAIAASTERLRLGTGVTCPLIRIHPAIIAQAAATSAAMMAGRFFLGVGTGENLNEHITDTKWPEVDVRLEMLQEAIELIRRLWSGETISHRGRHYTVENARIYTRPNQPPPIFVAGAGTKSSAVAGKSATERRTDAGTETAGLLRAGDPAGPRTGRGEDRGLRTGFRALRPSPA